MDHFGCGRRREKCSVGGSSDPGQTGVIQTVPSQSHIHEKVLHRFTASKQDDPIEYFFNTSLAEGSFQRGFPGLGMSIAPIYILLREEM